VVTNEFDLVVVDRNDVATSMKLPPGPYRYPRASPDGNRIVLETDDGKEAVVRIHDRLRGGVPRRFTYAGKNRFPIWAAKGSRIAFQSDRHGDAGIFWQPADGSDAERLTTAAAGESHIPESWHPLEDVLVFSVLKGGEYMLRAYSVGDRKPRHSETSDRRPRLMRCSHPTENGWRTHAAVSTAARSTSSHTR
jgi:Tol biopolymer transport system component